MRTLGPGSVSSFLKIILDVVYVALWVGVAVVGLSALASLLFDVSPRMFGPMVALELNRAGESGPLVTAALVAAAAYMAGVQIIVDRLRRIFATLTAGDPFHPDNVRRLRVVGMMLAALELGRYPFAAIQMWLSPDQMSPAKGVSLTAWFAVLVVFVLAEIFREGARLRREAELTI